MMKPEISHSQLSTSLFVLLFYFFAAALRFSAKTSFFIVLTDCATCLREGHT
jgi:hypothetical protein